MVEPRGKTRCAFAFRRGKSNRSAPDECSCRKRLISNGERLYVSMTEEGLSGDAAVAGSFSWVARQCRLHGGGTASTLQGAVSRAVVKDFSDANRTVNLLKQTEDVGLPIHVIPLVDLHTVSISDAALDLDRPDGSTQGGFMVGFSTSELHQQGSAVMSPMSWSSDKVKRSVSASLAGEVFMMSEGLVECEWSSDVLESAIYQYYEPSLHRRESTPLPAEPTVAVMKADSRLQVDPSSVCHRCQKRL